MKKRVDLLQVTDAENRLTQLGCTCPISCTTKASPQVVGMRGESQEGLRTGREVDDRKAWRDLVYCILGLSGTFEINITTLKYFFYSLSTNSALQTLYICKGFIITSDTFQVAHSNLIHC